MNQEGIEIEILLDYLSDDDENFKAQQGKKPPVKFNRCSEHYYLTKYVLFRVKIYYLVMKYMVPAIHKNLTSSTSQNIKLETKTMQKVV